MLYFGSPYNRELTQSHNQRAELVESSAIEINILRTASSPCTPNCTLHIRNIQNAAPKNHLLLLPSTRYNPRNFRLLDRPRNSRSPPHLKKCMHKNPTTPFETHYTLHGHRSNQITPSLSNMSGATIREYKTNSIRPTLVSSAQKALINQDGSMMNTRGPKCWSSRQFTGNGISGPPIDGNTKTPNELENQPLHPLKAIKPSVS